MADLLLDTDVFIDHLRGARPIVSATDRVSFSVITRAELYAGPEAQEENVRRLLSPFHELEVGAAVAEEAGRIRRRLGLALPDALVAATAIGHGLTLVTRNLRHFERVPALTVRSPS